MRTLKQFRIVLASSNSSSSPMGLSVVVLSLIIFSFCVTEEAQQHHSSYIRPGSSLLNTTANSTSWPSSSGLFQFGFYQEGNGFMVGIWMSHGGIVVWTADRDDPAVAANSTLELTMDGKLVLRTHRGGEKLIANTTSSAAFASMLDSGNFVLYNKDSKVIWQSFDHPTDTILGGQKLLTGRNLVSSSSMTDHSSGRYRLEMQTDGNLVSYPLISDDTSFYAYWASDTSPYKTPLNLYLNFTATLAIINTTDSSIIKTLWESVNGVINKTIVHRATLGFDGVFTLYSHNSNKSDEFQFPVKWRAPENPCDVIGFCGLNSFCTLNDFQPYCVCIPGNDFIDPNHRSLGCRRNSSQEGCIGGRENTSSLNITTMKNMLVLDVPYADLSISLEECNKSCFEDCYCRAAQYMEEGNAERSCKKLSLPLKYVQRASASSIMIVIIKVGTRIITSDNQTELSQVPVVIKSKRTIMWILIVTVGLLTISCAALALSGLFVFKIRVLKYKRLLEYGSLDFSEELTLQFFSFNELKKATNGFKEELGKGSFGAVYKGTLCKGKKFIAVKRLEKVVEEGEPEFLAEVRAIGRTSHRNLVRLLGYCNEDSKRLLVYEYMSNGSLADLLFTSTRSPDWNERMRIALNVARGILYLHEECDAPIIHCDIKPQNILMDDFWNAKISDFGMSKLLMPDQTRTFTRVRGTRGYMAPEWQRNTPISVKADVYSYGIVLLEIVCCRRNMDVNVTNPEELVLSTWVYNCFDRRELNKLVGSEEVDKKTLENMVKVGLWCIQDELALRPSMKSVVLMLEGITEIAIPPCPTAFM